MLYTTILMLSTGANAMLTTLRTNTIVPQSSMRTSNSIVMRPWSAPPPVAKAEWLAKQELPSWGNAATVIMDEVAAKAAWLAKHEVRGSWGPAQ